MAFKKVKKEESFAYWFINEFGTDKFNNLIIHEKISKAELIFGQYQKEVPQCYGLDVRIKNITNIH